MSADNRIMYQLAPALPGFTPPAPKFAPRTSAAIWPVRRGSVDIGAFRFLPPPPRKELRRWYQAAYEWDLRTRQPGKHGGALGRAALDVLKTLSFGFLNFKTGRLDPTRKTIAEKTNGRWCERTVFTATDRLRERGLLDWTKRCCTDKDADDHFRRRQVSNAYTIMSPANWVGYREPTPKWQPAPGTWGDHPPMSDIDSLRCPAAHGIAYSVNQGDSLLVPGSAPGNSHSIDQPSASSPGAATKKVPRVPLSQAERAALTDAERMAYDGYVGEIWTEGARQLLQTPERFGFTVDEFTSALLEDDPPPWVRDACERFEQAMKARRSGVREDAVPCAAGHPPNSDSLASRAPPQC